MPERDQLMLARIMIREAFFAGWEASGEGYNGEWPGNKPQAHPELVEAAETFVERFDIGIAAGREADR